MRSVMSLVPYSAVVRSLFIAVLAYLLHVRAT